MTPRLGRKPRLFDPRIPHLSALRLGDPAPSPPPSSADWTTKLDLNRLGMFANDQVGDCVEAGSFAHLEVTSSITNLVDGMIREPDACALKAYEEAGGYNPADPATDQGTDIQSYLHYWMTRGIPTGPEAATRHTLLAALEIDPRQQGDVQWAIEECGSVYLGMNVPNYAMGPGGSAPLSDWAWPAPPGADASIAGGHCVIAPRFNADGLTFLSWGAFYGMDWGFWAEFVDEAYALLDRDWITAMGTTPLGLTIADWEAVMRPFTQGPPPAA